MNRSTPFLTPVRLWLHGKNGNNGRWADDIEARCRWCGWRFPIRDEILDVIMSISCNYDLYPNTSPCFDFPEAAWDDPRLLSDCPHCRRPVRVNPFLVDNKTRFPDSTSPASDQKTCHKYKEVKKSQKSYSEMDLFKKKHHINEASRYLCYGDLDKAIDELLTALVRYPDSPDVLAMLKELYNKVGDKAAVAKVCRDLSDLLRHEGKNDEAENLDKEARDLEGRD